MKPFRGRKRLAEQAQVRVERRARRADPQRTLCNLCPFAGSSSPARRPSADRVLKLDRQFGEMWSGGESNLRESLGRPDVRVVAVSSVVVGRLFSASSCLPRVFLSCSWPVRPISSSSSLERSCRSTLSVHRRPLKRAFLFFSGRPQLTLSGRSSLPATQLLHPKTSWFHSAIQRQSAPSESSLRPFTKCRDAASTEPCPPRRVSVKIFVLKALPSEYRLWIWGLFEANMKAMRVGPLLSLTLRHLLSFPDSAFKV